MRERSGAGTTTGANAGFFARSLGRWREMAHAVGVVQTRFLMFAFYLVMVVPTGLLMRLFRDPLHLRLRRGSNWSPVESAPPSLETARRQF
jgi:hypothetical protein